MAFIKVVGMFDDRAALERAKAELVDRGIVLSEDIHVEPDPLSVDPRGSEPPHIWRRLKKLFTGHSNEDVGAYAEGVRRGSLLLVVTVPEEDAEKVKQVIRENGAVELRRRVLRWRSTGWQNFDPGGLAVTEEEIVEERRQIAAEKEQAAAEEGGARNIRLFDEESGREIGRISESELRALQDALEEEGPDDHDYWINADEIDDIASQPGATPHLIRLLREAVRGKPDGVEISFQREGEERQGLRGGERTTHRG